MSPGLSGRTRKLQKTALALLILVGIINYFDRASLAIAVVSIRHDLGLGATAIGAMLSAFAFSYALAQLPTGLLIDRFGPRVLLGCGLTVWSVAQAAAGLSSGYAQLFLSRIVLGIGEAPQFPSSARVINNWFHIRVRGLSAGIFGAGTHIGPVVAPPLLTLIMLCFGWRVMFISLGVVGLLAGLMWCMYYRDPEPAGVSADELAQIREGDQPSGPPITLARWARLFRDRTTWGMILGNFGNGYCFWLFQAWLPGYLEMERHVSIARTGFYAAIPELCGMTGSLLGGALADRLAAAGLSPVDSRKYPIAVALIGVAIFTLAAAYATTSTAALIWLCAAVFCSSVAGATIWALVNAAAPPEYVASSGSIQNFGSFIGGTCSSLATGVIVDATGSFVPALVVAAVISVGGALAYLFIVKRPIDGSRLAADAFPDVSTDAQYAATQDGG